MEAIKNVPTYYPVYCKWCEAEGIENRIGRSVVEHSHGICEHHAEKMYQDCLRMKQEVDESGYTEWPALAG